MELTRKMNQSGSLCRTFARRTSLHVRVEKGINKGWIEAPFLHSILLSPHQNCPSPPFPQTQPTLLAVRLTSPAKNQHYSLNMKLVSIMCLSAMLVMAVAVSAAPNPGPGDDIGRGRDGCNNDDDCSEGYRCVARPNAPGGAAGTCDGRK